MPTREACFADNSPARAHARWRAARAESARRHAELLRELHADEERAFAKLGEMASGTAELERHIRLARELLERERRPNRGRG